MPNIKQMAHDTACAGETRLENPVRERRVDIFSASRHCGRRRAHRESQKSRPEPDRFTTTTEIQSPPAGRNPRAPYDHCGARTM
jgi:hypothetical protein